MFGFGSNDDFSEVRHPSRPRGMISPSNYGYTNVFIEDDSELTLKWEFNGAIPTEKMVRESQETKVQREKELQWSEELRENIQSISENNAQIIQNFTATKAAVASNSGKQYASYSRLFGKMDDVNYRHQLTQAKRNGFAEQAAHNYRQSLNELRRNATLSQKKRQSRDVISKHRVAQVEKQIKEREKEALKV